MKTKCVLLVIVLGTGCLSANEPPGKGTPLPAFSEEREAAALLFARKQAPDLVPLLDKLKNTDLKKYHTEVSEIFQVCEWLTDMRAGDEKRYALELDIWKMETRSLIVVARMAGLKEDEREKHKEELQDCAKKLVDLEMLIMKYRIEALEKELGEARDDFAKGEEQRETLVKERYSKLFEEAKRRGMMK